MTLAEKIRLERERFALAKKRLRDSHNHATDSRNNGDVREGSESQVQPSSSRNISIQAPNYIFKKNANTVNLGKDNFENVSEGINLKSSHTSSPAKNRCPETEGRSCRTTENRKEHKQFHNKGAEIKGRKLSARSSTSAGIIRRKGSNNYSNSDLSCRNKADNMEKHLRKSILSQAVLEAKNSKAEAKLQEMEREVLEKTHSCKLLKQKVSELKGKVCKLENQLSERNIQFASIQAELNAATEQASMASQRYYTEHEAYLKAEKTLDGTTKQFNTFRKESESATDELKAEILRLGSAKKLLEEDLNCFKSTIQKLQNKQDYDAQELKILNEKLITVQREVEEAKEESSNAKISLKLAENKNIDLRKQYSKLETQKLNLQTKYDKLELILEEERNKNKELLINKEEKLQLSHAKANDQRREMKDMLEKLEETTKNLANEVESHKEEKERMQGEIESLNNRLNKEKVNGKAKTEANAELLRIKSSTILELQKKVEILENEKNKNFEEESSLVVALQNQLEEMKIKTNHEKDNLNKKIEQLKLNLEQHSNASNLEKDATVKALRREAEELRHGLKLYLEKEKKMKEEIDSGKRMHGQKAQEEKFEAISDELVVDVDLPNGTTAELIVRQGENPKTIVERFSSKHNISERVAILLRKYVLSQLQAPGYNEHSNARSPRFDASPRAKSQALKCKTNMSPPPPPPSFDYSEACEQKEDGEEDNMNSSLGYKNDVEEPKNDLFTEGQLRRLSRLKRISRSASQTNL